MAVPGVSSVGSAVGKGASATKAAKTTATASKGAQTAQKSSSRILDKSQGVAKSKAQQLSRAAEKYGDSDKRQELLDKAKDKASNKEKIGNLLDKQSDLQKVAGDNKGFTGLVNGLGAKKDLGKAEAARRRTRTKERVETIDRIGVRGRCRYRAGKWMPKRVD